MAKNLVQRRAPGSVQPFVSLNPAPVIANRAPNISDNYEPSTIWIEQVDNMGAPVNDIWILASTQDAVSNWIQVTGSGGFGVFNSLTVNPGPTDLTGDVNFTGTLTGADAVFDSLTVNPGPINLTGTLNKLGAVNINISGPDFTHIGTGTNTGGVQIGNIGGTQSVLILGGNGVAINNSGPGTTQIGTGTNSGNVSIGNSAGVQTVTITTAVGGGLNLAVAGQLSATALSDVVASPGTDATIDANLGYASFTGFTTAAAAPEVLTITNNHVLANSSVLLTVNNEGSNDAQMTLTRLQVSAGLLTVTMVNNGAAALNGDINITFWVLD